MHKLAAGLTLTGLFACSACLGAMSDQSASPGRTTAPSASAPAPQEPGDGSLVERWTEFVRTAKQERLPRRTWPSTAKNASVTAAILCHNPESHGATEVDLYHGKREWPEIREGDILFARAFCPEAEPALRRALSGRPGHTPGTTVPAMHSRQG